MSDAFRELRGDYVENQGQSLNLGEYLDYFEPLGSSLSRLPDGVGGPFIHQFTDSAGRTISSVGWVVSAASKRFGGWRLRGLWSDRPIPAIAFPLLWPQLGEPDLVRHANADTERLFDPDSWPELFDELQTHRLRDGAFRDALKSQLARVWTSKPPYEIEVTNATLDLLPWLYLLGPVDPEVAQLKPSRFNGAGYQYILADALPAPVRVPGEIDELVDTAANDAYAGWQLADELRARRNRPARPPAVRTPAPRTPASRPQPEIMPMQTRQQQRTRKPAPAAADWSPARLTPLYQLLVVALLAFIAWNVWEIRKGIASTVNEPATTPQQTAAPEVVTPEPVPRDVVARTAVEIFLRRNNCFARTEAVDGRLSAAELRATRNCAAMQTARLMNADGTVNDERAVAWLDRTAGSSTASR